MNKKLVIFAHPAAEKSQAGNFLLGGVDHQKIHFHDLYEQYPRFMIDVGAEKQLLEKHRVIILQFPFYWYSCPALLKEWFDVVLEYGYAYGPGGDALKGKYLWPVITAGGSIEAYHPEGRNNYYIRDLLRPIEQTARLCGMVFVPPLVLYSSMEFDKSKSKEGQTLYSQACNSLDFESLDFQLAAPQMLFKKFLQANGLGG